MKRLVFAFFILIVAIADIRIDNNDLSADGIWEMVYNPNGAKNIIDSINTVVDNDKNSIS